MIASSIALNGSLNVYNNALRLSYFESGISGANNSVIFVGGLGDGLAAIPVLSQLSAALSNIGDWSLIQVLTRSSYSGWAMGSVDQDAEDLHAMEMHLRDIAGKTGKLVLLGHSTGCQDIVRFFQMYPETTYSAAVLQAPVSDRQHWEDVLPPTVLHRLLDIASEEQKAGRAKYPLPKEALEVIAHAFGLSPVCADRWLSLTSPGGRGKEDFFSSDLTDEQLDQAFSGLRKASVPVLLIMSEKDEYVPSGIDKHRLLERFAQALTPSAKDSKGSLVQCHVAPGADHSITQEAEMQRFTDMLVEFAAGLR